MKTKYTLKKKEEIIEGFLKNKNNKKNQQHKVFLSKIVALFWTITTI